MANNTEDVAFKKYFEANLLDGDDVYDCGKAIISAEYVYEVMSEFHRQEINRQKAELLDRLEKHSAEYISAAYKTIDGVVYLDTTASTPQEVISVPLKAIQAERNQLGERV